jgi:hypothetical protein
VAMNYSMNPEATTNIYYEENTIRKAILINENISGLNRLVLNESASGSVPAYIPADSLMNLMENRLLTRTIFKTGNRIIKLWYPESDSKSCVVTNNDLITGAWTHYIFGNDDKPEEMLDWKRRNIPIEECFFLKYKDSGMVKISMDCPMMYTTMNNIEIPIMWVAPKLFETIEDISEEFNILENIEVEVINIPYGIDADEIVNRIMNDEDVSVDDLFNLFTCNPSKTVVENCVRILGQNLYTSRLIESEAVDLTVVETEPFDLMSAIENMDLSEDVAADDDETIVINAHEITKIRAANSIGFTIARLFRTLNRSRRANFIRQLSTIFSNKLLGCAIVVAISE